MLSAYILTIDIATLDRTISEQEFQKLVAPSLEHLDHLKRAFDRSPSTKKYYPPGEHNSAHGWSVRGVVLISVGKQRGDALLRLYKSISELILHELPDLDISAHADVKRFS